MTDSAMKKLADDAREIVRQGEHIRVSLRKLTLAGIHRGHLEATEIRNVVKSILQGAIQGLGSSSEKSRIALSEALNGVDDALAKSAEATKLALDEAAGRLKDFARHDLDRAVNDLRTLEQLLLETLQQTSEQSSGEVREILQGLLNHARTSGTDAGKVAANAISALENKFGRALHEIVASASGAAIGAGSKFSESASKFLAGIADSLDTKADQLRKGR